MKKSVTTAKARKTVRLAPYTTVLMDCDGVLIDFTRTAMRWHGADNKVYPRGEWSIPNVLGIGETEFWAKIDNYDFWNEVPAYPGAAKFLASVYEACQSAGSSLVFCTRSSPNVGAFSTARTAIVRKLCREAKMPEDTPVYVCVCGGKAVFGAPGRLLVDDHPGHVADFRCVGGGGFLVPTQWNAGPWVSATGSRIGMTPDYKWLTAALNSVIVGRKHDYEID